MSTPQFKLLLRMYRASVPSEPYLRKTELSGGERRSMFALRNARLVRFEDGDWYMTADGRCDFFAEVKARGVEL